MRTTWRDVRQIVQLKDGKLVTRETASAHRRTRLNLPVAHSTLGGILSDLGKFKEAETASRQAIQLDPRLPVAHNNLGLALFHQRKVNEAERAYRETIRLKSEYAIGHYNLGHALQKQGRFVEALAAFRCGHSLGNKSPGWPDPSASCVRKCERLVGLDRLLRQVLDGEAEPATGAERLELMYLCQEPFKRLHHNAARLAIDAFAGDPKLANEIRADRFLAACSAILAAAGQAEDARMLPVPVVHALRRQALTWLRADLALYANLARAHNNPQMNELLHRMLVLWKQRAELASVRDKEALDRLPTDECDTWRRLWDEVDVMQKKVQRKK